MNEQDLANSTAGKPTPQPEPAKAYDLNKCDRCQIVPIDKANKVYCDECFKIINAPKAEPAKGEWSVADGPVFQKTGWYFYLNTDTSSNIRIGPFQTQEEAQQIAAQIVEAVKTKERLEWCSFSVSALKGWEIQYRLDDGRHYVYDEKGNFVWSGEPKFNAWRCGQMDREIKSLRQALECRERVHQACDEHWKTATNKIKHLWENGFFPGIEGLCEELLKLHQERDQLKAGSSLCLGASVVNQPGAALTCRQRERLKVLDGQHGDLWQAIGWLRDRKLARPKWVEGDEDLWGVVEACVKEWHGLKRADILRAGIVSSELGVVNSESGSGSGSGKLTDHNSKLTI